MASSAGPVIERPADYGIGVCLTSPRTRIWSAERLLGKFANTVGSCRQALGPLGHHPISSKLEISILAG